MTKTPRELARDLRNVSKSNSMRAGVPARMGRLRGYGNAIKPPLGAQVIAAYMEICEQ